MDPSAVGDIASVEGPAMLDAMLPSVQGLRSNGKSRETTRELNIIVQDGKCFRFVAAAGNIALDRRIPQLVVVVYNSCM